MIMQQKNIFYLLDMHMFFKTFHVWRSLGSDENFQSSHTTRLDRCGFGKMWCRFLDFI